MKIRVKWPMVMAMGLVLSACQSTPIPPKIIRNWHKSEPKLQSRYWTWVSSQAKQQLDAALSADRQFAPAYRTLAKVYQASEDATHQTKAQRLFEKAIELNPKDMQSYMDYGFYLVQMGTCQVR